MKKPNDADELRKKLIGLGEFSSHKSYYPELQDKIIELEKTKNKYKNIFDNAINGIFQLSTNLSCINANPSLAKILGYKNVEHLLQYSNWNENVFDSFDDKQKFAAILLANGIILEFETKLFRFDRSVIWASINAKLVRGENYQEPFIEGFIVDITQRKQTEVELAKYRENLEELVSLRTKELEETNKKLVQVAREAGRAEVVNSLLHNVGNLTNSINTNVDDLKERLKNSTLTELVNRVLFQLNQAQPNIKEFLCNIEDGQRILKYLPVLLESIQDEKIAFTNLVDGIHSSTEMISSFLTIQSGFSKTSTFEEQVSISETINESLNICRGEFHIFEIQIEKDFQFLPTTYIDRYKLIEILITFFKFGVNSLQEKGTAPRLIKVELKKSNEHQFLITIHENGVGTEAKDIDELFAPKFLFKNTKGFGLHNSALMIKEMGGDLKAESGGLNQGTTFYITLPLK